MNRGTLFVVTGPSGAGKGTVLSRVFATTDRLFYSISVTTRQPREGERHGVDYYFFTQDQVRELIRQDLLLEYAEYVDNIYGTPVGPVEDMLAAGRDVILEIEVRGALQVKERRPDAVMVFITPPGFEELERRLRGRGTDSEEKIGQRLEKAREEYRKIAAFDFVVMNDNIEDAADELRSIIIAQRCRTGKRLDKAAFGTQPAANQN